MPSRGGFGASLKSKGGGKTTLTLGSGGIDLSSIASAIEQVEFENFLGTTPELPTSPGDSGGVGGSPTGESSNVAAEDPHSCSKTAPETMNSANRHDSVDMEVPRASGEEATRPGAGSNGVPKAKLALFIRKNAENILALGAGVLDSPIVSDSPTSFAKSSAEDALSGDTSSSRSSPSPNPAAPKVTSIGNFISGNIRNILVDSRTENLDRHVTGTANHLLQKELPSPFDEVCRADTLTIIIKKIHVPARIAEESNLVRKRADGRNAIKNAQVTLKLRHLELKTPIMSELFLDQDIKIRFQVPVNYHAILFDQIVLVFSQGDKKLSRARIPIATMKPFDPDAPTKLKGTLPIKLRSYEDTKNVKSTRKGNFGLTQQIRLDDFGTAYVDYAFSFTGEQAMDNRTSELGKKGFYHASEVEKWLVDGIAPPPGRIPERKTKWGLPGSGSPIPAGHSPPSTALPSPTGASSPKPSFGEITGQVDGSPTTATAPVSLVPQEEVDGGEAAVEVPLRSPALSRVASQGSSFFGSSSSEVSRGKLVRDASASSMSTINSSGVPAGRRLSRSKTTGADAAKQMVRVETVVGVTSSDDQEEDLPSGTMPLARSETGTALASKKKAKALGEIEPVMKGFGAGMRISLSSLKFLYNAFQTVRKMLVDVPHPPFVDKDERKRSVNLERVREARWWLKFSNAAYLQSAAAPFLLPGHARKANIAMVSRFLGIQDADMLLYQEQAGAFTSKFFVCWTAEKKSLVIAVRGTAGVHEALADLNGEYIPFRTGVSHKGFVFSANYIYNNFRQQLLDWTKKLNPKRIVCTGHSYGGSVAAILSILLRDDLTQLRELAQNPGMEVEAITFGAAPTISKELSSETLHIEAYVNFLDPVPSLCYGTMLDLRELLIESDDLFDQGWDHELALGKLAMIHQRLAKSSFLKLQVAGRIWLLRESPSSIAKSSDVPAGREPGSEAKPRSLWDRLFRSRGGSDGAQPPPPATSATFAGLFASSETYIAEPCAPRDLFVLRSHPDSMAKPHLCAQYGAALKSVVSTQNNG